MMTELLVAAAGSIAFVIGRISTRRRMAPEPRCTGYRDYLARIQTDCRSLRSPTCMDGRCTFHCHELCKCDAPNEPEFIGRRRS